MLKKIIVPPIIVFLFVIAGLLIFVSDVYAETDYLIGIDFAGGYAPNKSMNNAVKGYGEVEKKAGHAFAGELESRIFFDFIGFGVNAGAQNAGEAESKKYMGHFIWDWYQYRSLELKAYSYLGTLYFKIINYNDHIVLLGAGAGYYNATIEYRDDENGIDRKYKGNTIGYHAKIEYNFIYKHLYAFGGFMFRYVKIDEFKSHGETLIVDGEKVEGSFTGYLFYLGVGWRI
jgi:hypothetical protein